MFLQVDILNFNDIPLIKADVPPIEIFCCTALTRPQLSSTRITCVGTVLPTLMLMVYNLDCEFHGRMCSAVRGRKTMPFMFLTCQS